MTIPRKHLDDGLPVEVVRFRCPKCGPTSVICDDYAVLSPLDGGGVQPLSGTCTGCRGRVEFMTAVSVSNLRIPAGDNTPPSGRPKGTDNEPIIPE